MNYKFLILIIFSVFFIPFLGQSQTVKIQEKSDGFRMIVDGKPFMVNGMNWDYFPIGTNYNYSLWDQPDDIVQAALDSEMSLLKNMNVNAIRVYSGIPARWITYIYNNYGIYTMLNHSFGRYGLNLEGNWTPNTEYGDEKVKSLLLKETKEMVSQYKNTPGLLLFLLGNENNYGLFWEGAETEDIPMEDRKSTQRAIEMYKLFNEAAAQMKQIDNSHPVAICNGDLLFLDIITKECPDVDILGVNMYRGISFTDAFDRVKQEYNKPLLFTEFGSDAFNVKLNEEDQSSQAQYLVENWKEIYENAAGQGKAGNSIGGFTFQFSDGWWKYKQTEKLDVHDNNASWSNGGYQFDFEEGENNMNEEWFGICAKGPTNSKGLYTLYPRAAYFALKEVHKINPYEANVSIKSLESDINGIPMADAVLKGRSQTAAMEGSKSKILNISKMRAEFTTFNTGGSLITTPKTADPDDTTYPDKTGFDHMESFYFGVEGQPSANMRANVEFNVLGNVATNPINEIFYEDRGRPVEVTTPNGTTTLNDINRVAVYKAGYNWNNKYFNLDGFYRTGHYHWEYEGDFFGLYREANYGSNLDIYNGIAPVGFEFEGKKFLKGFKAAFGPQLWWGANPGYLLKYSKDIKKFNFTAVFHDDIQTLGEAQTSYAIPQPKTRQLTAAIKRDFGKFGFQLGGIWGGQPLVNRTFQNYNEGVVYEDYVRKSDTWGGKAKITFKAGKFNWYAAGATQGLVANGGADQTQTFTGWRLKDTGSGNQNNFLTGFTYNVGKFQIAPNFLWQEPLVAAIPNDVEAPGRKRNIIQDPFVVRANRKTTAGELLITYDPTPETWYYAWDNDRAEDAPFAMNAGFVYRHLPTTMDAAVGFDSQRNPLIFGTAPPAHDLWELYSRIVSKPISTLGIIANFYAGNGQANGSDPRLIHRFGGDLRVIYKKMKFIYGAKFNDWGPYDYHRDFNLTYPMQLVFDISTTLESPNWFILPNTQLGIRGTYRTLDQYSPRYAPAQTPEFGTQPIISPVGFPDGNEWEIRTYLHINIGK